MRKYKLNALCRERRRFPANISCFPRRLQDVFAIRLPKTSSRRLQGVFKTSSRRLPRRLQDEFARRLAIMSSRRLQYVFTKTNVCWVVNNNLSEKKNIAKITQNS